MSVAGVLLGYAIRSGRCLDSPQFGTPMIGDAKTRNLAMHAKHEHFSRRAI
ncbi:hypothetical protein RESH_03227 [Rhodopirellula europaea SH398]|uniref:Uncharacterized protein n=2 Tax=Rhodopirellula europaea TaxID=1263866 RepID=M2A447_9BACT|nr:hypothetical protein RE6C_05023 [Rhodopirellula europaea 6C]EMI26191.1 hypothetical protein RESH_03227 [Rhodopirellula europaea SH398]